MHSRPNAHCRKPKRYGKTTIDLNSLHNPETPSRNLLIPTSQMLRPQPESHCRTAPGRSRRRWDAVATLWGFGFRAWGFGFRVWGLGFRVSGSIYFFWTGSWDAVALDLVIWCCRVFFMQEFNGVQSFCGSVSWLL